MNTTATVTTITSENEHEAASTLASAATSDPLFKWICHDETRRTTVLPPLFRIITSAIGRHGTSHLLGEADAAALWVPPGEALIAESQMEAFIDEVAELAPVDAERVLAAFEATAAVHPAEPCWYLNFIGVSAERQGRGHGTTLLRAGIERADDDWIPSYVEATSPENRRLYERHGFVAVGSIDLPGGPQVTPMWREPGAAWAI